MPLDGVYEPSPDTRTREQVELYESSGGTQGTTWAGRPVIILTSLGARSGKVRKVPLMRVEHDGRYAVVASLGGAPQHPTWYHNLRTHPLVELQDGPRVGDYVAREVTGDERDAWWARSVAAYPDYADYATKTERVIPVLVLEPADEQAPGAASTGTTTEQVGPASGSSERADHGDEEIVEFWESARSRAGLGRIAVVGGLTVAAGVPPMAWSFGDNPALADELLGLVLDGTKTATSSMLAEYDDGSPLPAVGDLSIILDGAGHPRALIRTTEVEVLPFAEVTEDFAAAEGEGDRSLEHWRSGHSRYFQRVLGVDSLPDDLMVVAERFELLYPR